MHAGVLFSLGEFLGGLITARYLDNPRKFQPVVRDLKIDFKAPAMTDITATAYFSAEQALEMNAKLEETGRYDFQQKAVLTMPMGLSLPKLWARMRYAILWDNAYQLTKGLITQP